MRDVSYEEYLASPGWRSLRTQALARDDYSCRVCNGRTRLEVHHRCYPRVLGTEDVRDLTTLCHSCHDLFSRPSQRDRSLNGTVEVLFWVVFYAIFLVAVWWWFR